eukprot:g5787.t1
MMDNARAVKLLLDYGADKDKDDFKGQTALYDAAETGLKNIAQLLLDAGADPYKSANDGTLPVDIAKSKALKKLLRRAMKNQKASPLPEILGATIACCLLCGGGFWAYRRRKLRHAPHRGERIQGKVKSDRKRNKPRGAASAQKHAERQRVAAEKKEKEKQAKQAKQAEAARRRKSQQGKPGSHTNANTKKTEAKGEPRAAGGAAGGSAGGPSSALALREDDSNNQEQKGADGDGYSSEHDASPKGASKCRAFDHAALLKAREARHLAIKDSSSSSSSSSAAAASSFANSDLTALHVACRDGRYKLVKRLLAADGIDVNAQCEDGRTPLLLACAGGHHKVVELLLEDQRVDANILRSEGPFEVGPLAASITALLDGMDALDDDGTESLMRSLVLLLASRRVSTYQLEEAVECTESLLPTEDQIEAAEAAGELLNPLHRAAQLLYPILRAQATGKRRWCAWCFEVTPDDSRYDRETTRIRGLDVCSRCKEVGYCSAKCQ